MYSYTLTCMHTCSLLLAYLHSYTSTCILVHMYLQSCASTLYSVQCLQTFADVNNSAYLYLFTCSHVLGNLADVNNSALGTRQPLPPPPGCQSIKLETTTSRSPFNTFPTKSVNKLDQSIKLEELSATLSAGGAVQTYSMLDR